MHDVMETDPEIPGRAAPTSRARCGEDVVPAGGNGHALQVRIYRPARSVMQAGRASAKDWVLEFEPRSAPFIDPLMGWTGTRDTLRQVRLKFPTRERAVTFAARQGWTCAVSEPHESRDPGGGKLRTGTRHSDENGDRQ